MQIEQLVVQERFSLLGDAFFAKLAATPLQNPQLLALSPLGMQQLGLADNAHNRQKLTELCGGTWQFANYQPLAMVYAGHQFGGYSPRLGDGRGLLVAEVATAQGNLDLHVKGAGLTPFSRMGDGRAVLRSSIREFLISEYMQALGIPTSHVLALVRSDSKVWREYQESAASLIRLAPSHIRFGHFEYFYYSRQLAEHQQLAEYVLEQHYPECQSDPQPMLAMLKAIIARTARLLAKWQAYGFCHGVMNTDNMSILGITFDYGPFAFLDDYQANYICNSSDHTGRYAFNQQPQIALWNLSALAETFTQNLAIADLKSALDEYWPVFNQHYIELMCQRLGMAQDAASSQLINDLLAQMQISGLDYNNLFRRLSEEALDQALSGLRNEFIDLSRFDQWAALYRQQVNKLELNAEQRLMQMQQINPAYLLRNYYLQQAIDASEKGDDQVFYQLQQICLAPFQQQTAWQHWLMPPPSKDKGIALSCSS